jgi:pimeloyl-ACP methyl ester carboxylesterase
MRYWILLLFVFCVLKLSGQPDRNALLKIIFESPLIESELIYPQVTSLDSLSRLIESKFPFKDEEIYSAYKRLKINKADRVADTLCVVNASLNRKGVNIYSYFKRGSDSTVAILMIPGSMDNQSYKIYHNLPNYHNTYDNIFFLNAEFGDSYLFIKPNEDILAIHNGQRKLSHEAIVPTLINWGTSYTANQIIQIIALIKHLKQTYEKVVVIGLSQGGYLALVTSVLAGPTAAVVASGYSIIFDELFFATLNQPISPNLNRFFNREKVKKSISLGRTKYLFSWEISDNPIYGYENHSLETYNYLNGTRNAQVYNKNEGHTFPQGAVIREFYRNVLLK